MVVSYREFRAANKVSLVPMSWDVNGAAWSSAKNMTRKLSELIGSERWGTNPNAEYARLMTTVTARMSRHTATMMKRRRLERRR